MMAGATNEGSSGEGRVGSVPMVSIESEPVRGTHGSGRAVSNSRSPSRSRTASDRDRPHAPMNSSHLARSESGISVDNRKERVEMDLTVSDPGHEREHALPAVRSLQNVRDALHRLGRTETRSRARDSLDGDPRRQRPLFNFMSRRHDNSDDIFQPIDPYRTKCRLFAEELEHDLKINRAWLSRLPSFHLGRIILLQLYWHLLLRLPSMYFTRICRLFEEAEVSKEEIQGMINGAANGWDWTRARDWTPANASPALKCFKNNWEEFIEIVIQEWKTLNVVSALLLGALLTMFQIDDANNDPFTRTFSLVSLICAAWSLIYGGVYIMRFRTMRSMYKASGFAQEAQESRMNVFWNVWVLLALPAVWLAWSLIMFFAAILSFVWTSGDSEDNPHNPSRKLALIPRVVITALFALGAVYFVFVVRTFRSYGAVGQRSPDGTAQDLAWQTGNFSLPETTQDHSHLSRVPNTLQTSSGNYGTDLARSYDVPQFARVSSQPQKISADVDVEKADADLKVVGVDNRMVDGAIRKGSPGIGGLDL